MHREISIVRYARFTRIKNQVNTAVRQNFFCLQANFTRYDPIGIDVICQHGMSLELIVFHTFSTVIVKRCQCNKVYRLLTINMESLTRSIDSENKFICRKDEPLSFKKIITQNLIHNLFP